MASYATFLVIYNNHCVFVESLVFCLQPLWCHDPNNWQGRGGRGVQGEEREGGREGERKRERLREREREREREGENNY